MFLKLLFLFKKCFAQFRILNTVLVYNVVLFIFNIFDHLYLKCKMLNIQNQKATFFEDLAIKTRLVFYYFYNSSIKT